MSHDRSFACALGAALLAAALATGTSLAATDELPRMHLTWRAPWGEPAATPALTTGCADTTLADTLYLTLEAPAHVLPLIGLSGALVIEPAAGDTLERFWFVERGDANAGAMLVDFDFLGGHGCSSPWATLVSGRVGYTRKSGRGRLDFSAEVPTERRTNLFPGACYVCARVTFRHTPGLDAACRSPVRITWIGGHLRTSRRGGEDLAYGIGAGRSVTWNAPRSGLRRPRAGLAFDTWVPRRAPASQATLAERDAMMQAPPGTSPTPPTSPTSPK